MTENEWISIKDRMPEKQKDVLFFSRNRIFHGWHETTCFHDFWFDIQNAWNVDDVTHWMNLPKFPNDEGGDAD